VMRLRRSGRAIGRGGHETHRLVERRHAEMRERAVDHLDGTVRTPSFAMTSRPSRCPASRTSNAIAFLCATRAPDLLGAAPRHAPLRDEELNLHLIASSACTAARTCRSTP